MPNKITIFLEVLGRILISFATAIGIDSVIKNPPLIFAIICAILLFIWMMLPIVDFVLLGQDEVENGK